MVGVKMEVLDGLLNDLVRGRIKPYELEQRIWQRAYKNEPDKWLDANKDASLVRLRFLEKKTGKRLENIEKAYVNTADSDKKTTGIEQQIGAATVPLGMAGPLKIHGRYARGEFFLPMATSEAALIAGISRGCRVINDSGGINVSITRDVMTRAPLIETPDIEKARELTAEILKKSDLYNDMKRAAETESRVSKLLDIQPFQTGRMIHIRFCFQTGDSMGMNSATKYAANAIRVLRAKYPWVTLKSLTANLCTDKKASHINVLLGRGKAVETEVLIPEKAIKRYFRTTPEKMFELNNLKNYKGSALAGTVTGFNANVANTIASMFIATGQDCAQIVESSSCFTHMEIRGKDLLFGITLPCLEIATVGGGTGYGTARDSLDILGCYGSGEPAGSNARKLAEIIAAAASAQELNLLGAESHGFELAESHIKLARGK